MKTPFKSILKYILLFVCFISLNSVLDGVFGATALFVGLLYSMTNPLSLSFTFALSFCVFRSYQMLLFGLIQAVVLGGIFFLYEIKHIKPKIEFIFYYFASVLPYIIWGNNPTENLVYSSIICLFSFIATTGICALDSIKNRVKPKVVESISLSVIFVICGVGFIQLFGANTYKAVAVLIMLFSITSLEKYMPYAMTGILATPLGISLASTNYFCIFFLWFILSIIFVGYSRIFSAIGIILGELLCVYVLNFYVSYQVTDALFVIIPALFFSFLPNSIFTYIQDYFTIKPNEMLCYGYINRTRTTLASKLYEVSGVFSQMQSSFDELKSASMTKADIVNKISAEAVSAVCTNCVLKERCTARGFPTRDIMSRFVEIGVAKNRVSLIDLPRDFTELCGYPNSIIFEVNRLIGEYLTQIKAVNGDAEGKNVFTSQIDALGKIMKGLAFDLSKTMSHDKSAENYILSFMKAQGLALSGVLILGEGDETEINVFAENKVVQNERFVSLLSKACGEKLIATNLSVFNDSLVSVTYKKSPEFDAIFGVSSLPKQNSSRCGDCHSLIKIDEGRFLVALADGMGSGPDAERTSTASLNLIESFYRAGLDSKLILQTVNKVLSLATSDNFSAVDLSIVNLYDKTADFIKIGAPYGLILNETGVRFIEGASLPLGILDELKPSMATLPLSIGDVLIFLSDGITDAFGSSAEMVEFLHSCPINNPKALADAILEQSLSYTNGIASDDMTAVCVRIIQKAS